MTTSMGAVRTALRAELEARGFDVASDSHGLRSGLYIVGENDLARAMFEFKTSAQEACDTMYHGSWVEGLPPRFAILPGAESESPELDFLQQIRVTVVFFHSDDGGVAFEGLDAALEGVWLTPRR